MSQGQEKMFNILVEGTGVSFSYGDYKPTKNSTYEKIVGSLSQSIDEDMDDQSNYCSLYDMKKIRAEKLINAKSEINQPRRGHNTSSNGNDQPKKSDDDDYVIHRCKSSSDDDDYVIHRCKSSNKDKDETSKSSNENPSNRKRAEGKQENPTNRKRIGDVIAPDISPSATNEQEWRDPEVKTVGWNLKRNANRRITRFLSLICSLKGVQPDVFLSLCLPRKWYEEMTIDEILAYYKHFLWKLKYHYRNETMWAIWKIEFSSKCLLHMHLYLKISNRYAMISSDLEDKTKETVTDLFFKAIKVNPEKCTEKCVDLESFGPWHYSYLCKPVKRGNEAHLISLIGKRQMFNVVNDKNIRVYKDVSFRLSSDEFRYFKEFLIHDAISRGVNPESWYKQFGHKHGHISFIPRQSIAKAILYARSTSNKS